MPVTSLLNVDERRIAFFLPNLHGGGAEKTTVNLLKDMSTRDIFLDLVLADADGPYLEQVPKDVRLFNFAQKRVVKTILPLSNYLRKEKPYALVSQLGHASVVAVVARQLAQTKTRLVLIEQSHLSSTKSKLLRSKLVLPLMKLLYPRAEAVAGVSEGVARDVEIQLNLPKGKVSVINNVVVDDELIAKSKAPLDHPWLQAGSPPVFLAVGRLTEQKDFFTLIKAFELVRKQRPVRLIILGEGNYRSELEAMVSKLGISEDVSLPGFVKNPYAYMSRASAFVLSSRWEGLPTVLIEAMACGCPVVSTDCPSGPKEILEAGFYGPLVSVGDVKAISSAMLQVLDAPVNRDVLIQRAMHYSTERLVPEYLTLLGYQ